MKKSLTIHDLPKEERPRERLEKYGVENLSAQELIALILGRGVRGESVMITAQKLLSKFGLQGLKEASLEDLKEIKGLGNAKSAQITACVEIARRINDYELSQATKVQGMKALSPQDVYMLLKPKIKNLTKEHFLTLSFDIRNHLLGVDTISIGTLTDNLVHPRETFEAAIRRHAAKIIIAHNHPSGDSSPSSEDDQVTKQIIEAGQILSIMVIDHVILSRNGYYSYASAKPNLFKKMSDIKLSR